MSAVGDSKDDELGPGLRDDHRRDDDVLDGAGDRGPGGGGGGEHEGGEREGDAAHLLTMPRDQRDAMESHALSGGPRTLPPWLEPDRGRARPRPRAKLALGAVATLVLGVAFVGAKSHAAGHTKHRAGPLAAPRAFERAVRRSALAGGQIAPPGPAAAGGDEHVVTVHRFRAMGCEIVLAGGDPAAAAARLRALGGRVQPLPRPIELSRVNASPARVLAVSPLFARGARGRARRRRRDRTASSTRRSAAAGATSGSPGRSSAAARACALDLNGVVKALAVDDAAATARRSAASSRPAATSPCAGRSTSGFPAAARCASSRAALATSGDRRTRGRHLVDPATGAPERLAVGAGHGRPARRCLAADVAAKAAFLLGDDGPAWLDERGMPGRFVGQRRRGACERARGHGEPSHARDLEPGDLVRRPRVRRSRRTSC